MFLAGRRVRGGAYGFKMKTLMKLKDTKGNSNATLVDFVLEMCQRKLPELVEW